MKLNPKKLTPFMGGGYGTRKNSEDCWLGRRGEPKRKSAGVRKLIIAPRRKHSRKPDETYERIEEFCSGPYCELFARQPWPNWDRWGLEADKFNTGTIGRVTMGSKPKTSVATSGTGTAAAVPEHLEKLFEKLHPVKPRVIFAVDATASRQPTWDMAAKMTAEMFRAAAGSGGLELQLVYYRGERECVASRWMPDAASIIAAMGRVMCNAGLTQIGRVLAHVEKENQRQKVAAAIVISDSCEETPAGLYSAAAKLKDVPVFMFQEGRDEEVAGIYRKIASATGGASCRFDAGAAARLADLLKAVAAFAVGGRKALSDQKTEAARLLLTQIK